MKCFCVWSFMWGNCFVVKNRIFPEWKFSRYYFNDNFFRAVPIGFLVFRIELNKPLRWYSFVSLRKIFWFIDWIGGVTFEDINTTKILPFIALNNRQLYDMDHRHVWTRILRPLTIQLRIVFKLSDFSCLCFRMVNVKKNFVCAIDPFKRVRFHCIAIGLFDKNSWRGSSCGKFFMNYFP